MERWQRFVVVCDLASDAAEQVRFAIQGRPRKGFGSVRVEVTVGDQVWRTSCFPSKDHDSYLLPIKAAVRRSEGLTKGADFSATIRLLEV